MQIEHIFMTYDGGAYNPSKLSYDPIAQEILDDPRVSNSLIFDKNRRTIYAQGLEYGKHHHTTSNNWHTATVFDIEALSRGAKRGRSLEYNITESKLYSQSPKSVKFSPNNEYLYSIDTNNVGRLFHIGKNYNLELLRETESVANVFWNYDGSILFVEEIKPNTGSAISAPTHYHTFIDIENEYDFPWQDIVGTINTFDIKDNFEYICINGLNYIKTRILLFLKPNRCFTIDGRNVPGGVKWYTIFNEIFISPDQSYAIVYADESLASNPGGRHYTMYIDLSSGNNHTITDNDIICDEWIVGDLLISPDGNYIMSCTNSFIDCISKTDLLNGNLNNTIELFDYSYDDVQWISNTNILLVHNQVVGTDIVPIVPKGSKGGGFEYNAAIMNAITGEVIYENFNSYVKCYLNDDKTKAIAVIIGIAQEEFGGLLKGNNVENIGDVYIWEFKDNNVIGPIYNINLSTSYDYNDDIEKGPSRSINYDQPNIKVIWNDDSSMVVVIDEYGNATVFDDEGNVISENIATNVSGGHWSNGNLYLDNAIETLNKPVIVDINLDIEGNLTYQTRNLQMGTGTYIGSFDLKPGHSGHNFITGIQQSPSGQVTYAYEYVTIPSFKNNPSYTNSHDSYNIVNVNLSNDGNFTYTYSDLKSTPNDGSYLGAYLINSPTSYLRVITGINQERDGKISYSYQSIYTNHGGKVQVSPGYDEDFISMVQLSADGQLTGSFGTFSSVRTGSTTSGVINNVNLDHTGKLSYSYVSLENLLNVTPTGSDDGPHTLQNNTSYQVITNITQNANGSISYSYSNINTTHTSTGIVDRDIDDRVITNVHLDADGNFSYSYANHETTTSDRLKAVKVGGDATITLTGPSTSYTFVTQIDQTSDGKIIYTYAYVNTTHTTATSNSNTNKVVTYVNLDSDGNFTYHLTDLSVTNGTAGSNMILTNDDAYKFITGITQASDGKISYTYSQLNTNFTYQGDNVDGPVYELNIDKTGKVSYVHKNLAVSSGVLSNDGDIITNDSTYRFITGISQASDGKISYTYGVFNTNFSNNGTTNGVLTNVNIDNTGHLSYDSVDLSTNSGNYNAVSYNTGVKITTTDGNPGKPLYTHVINNISQSANGKISYSYVGLYTDLKDYTYHNLTLFGVLPSIQDGNVAVINRISIDNQGIQKDHQLSYAYTQVPTREYVDSLITANDAMRYCGTFTGSGTTLSLSDSNNPDNPDTSKGAVYKCNTACTIGGQTFSVGDWIISNKDDASTTDITDGWDTFNVNITVNSVGAESSNTSKSTYVLTNVYADDTGTVSYTYDDLGVTNTGIDDNGSNELLASSYDVITGVKLTQNGLTTELSYTYTTIKVNQAHHSTNSASTGSQLTIKNADSENKVVTGVSLSADGTLSYTVQPLKTKSASTHLNAVNHEEYVITYAYLDSDGVLSYHTRDLSVSSGTQGTAVDLRSSSINVIDGITQDKSGKIAYHYASISATQNHHGGSASGDFLTGVELSQSGTLSGTNGTFSTHNYGAASGVITYVDLTHTGQLSYSYVDLSTKAADGQKLTNISLASGNVLTGISQTADGKITYSYATIGNDSFANHHSTDNTQTGGASKVIGAVHLSEDGKLSYSYTDIAKVAYHYTPAWPMLPLPSVTGVITIPYNSGESNSIVSYIHLTYDSKGHLIDSSQANYSFTHGTVPTSGSDLGQKVITIAAGGTNSDDLKSYTSLTTSNGHLTNSTYGSYVFKHGAPSGGTTYTIYTGSNEYIKTLSFAYDTNGHITSYSYTLATADFNDEKTKFVSSADKIYLGGTKTQAGNVTTNTYIDGITYVNNGTVFMEKTVIGNSSDDTISINAKAVTFNTPDTQFNFTGLKALWGVVGS